MGAADRERPDRLVHRHQAALAGRARTGRRRQDRARAAPARLADLAAGRRRLRAEPATDRGDASGTGYFSPASGPLAARAGRGRAGQAGRAAAAGRPGRDRGPHPRRRGAVRGHRGQHGRRARPGPGPGEVVVSIGTSGTAYAVAAGAGRATSRAGGRLRRRHRAIPAAGGHDQRGPGADGHGPDARHRRRRACRAWRWPPRPARAGLALLPYLDGERSPNRPGASGVLRGLTSTNTTPENLARAAVEAVLCSLADAIGNLADCGITAQRVILIGGAARSEAVRRIAPAIFGVPVTVPPPAEYVALGAARQAAWALSGAGSSRPPGRGRAPAPSTPPSPRRRYASATPGCARLPRAGTHDHGSKMALSAQNDP